jgi:hypothetical protein
MGGLPAADEFVTLVLASKGLEGGLDDTTDEAGGDVEGDLWGGGEEGRGGGAGTGLDPRLLEGALVRKLDACKDKAEVISADPLGHKCVWGGSGKPSVSSIMPLRAATDISFWTERTEVWPEMF